MKCVWSLESGELLEFNVYHIDDDWLDIGGVYIFAFRAGSNWYPIYVGQTDCFSKEIPEHEKLDKALAYGATHVHALIVLKEEERSRLKDSLIRTLNPGLN